MACAVEEVVEEHYESQRAELADAEPELVADVTRFQAEEREHRESASRSGARVLDGAHSRGNASGDSPGRAVLTGNDGESAGLQVIRGGKRHSTTHMWGAVGVSVERENGRSHRAHNNVRMGSLPRVEHAFLSNTGHYRAKNATFPLQPKI